MFTGACTQECACMRVYADALRFFRIVSTDKILCFINYTLITIIKCCLAEIMQIIVHTVINLRLSLKYEKISITQQVSH